MDHVTNFKIPQTIYNFSLSDEVDQLARNLGCRVIRTSVKEDVNVSSVFRYLTTKCHQIMMQQYNVVPVGQPTISEYPLRA